MTRPDWGTSVLVGVALWATIVGCAVPPNRTDSAQAPGSAAQGESGRTKRIVVAIAGDLPVLTNRVIRAVAAFTTPGGSEVEDLITDGLSDLDGGDVPQPKLAEAVPSSENGLWRILPDGKTETTWRIRENARWHDGTSVTTDDLLFTMTVVRDRELSVFRDTTYDLIELVQASDARTVTVTWSQPFIQADTLFSKDLAQPMPKHLLEDLYQSDKRNFDQSSRFRDEFVGLGAYRLVAWELGSHFEFEAFPDYFLGRPKMDRVVIRIVPDSNTAVANILAETVDLLPQRTLDLDATTEVQTRWRGTGNIVDIYPDGKGFTILEVQHRADFARPHGAVTMTQVRQGLYHAIDRQTLAHTLSHGLAPLADSWYAPNSELRSQLESFVPQFPHDRNRAQQLLEDAGWTLGTDGVRVHRQTGERLEIQITGDSAERERLALVVADDWRQVGAVGVPSTLPRALARDREAISTQPGVLISSGNYDFLIRNRLHTREMTSAENRWTGANRSGYSNPRVDGILDRLVVTVAPRERLDLHKELLRDQMGDVPLMPLYWSMHTWFAVAGVTGVRDGRLWNLHEWDKR